MSMPPKDIILAYVAGIIDGEGYVGIKKHKSRTCVNFTYQELIQVRMSNEETIKFLYDSIGGSYYKEKHKNGYKDMFTWYVSSKKAFSVLENIFPFLITKKKEAEIVLLLSKDKNKRGFLTGSRLKVLMPKEVVDYRELLYQKIKLLHGE